MLRQEQINNRSTKKENSASGATTSNPVSRRSINDATPDKLARISTTVASLSNEDGKAKKIFSKKNSIHF